MIEPTVWLTVEVDREHPFNTKVFAGSYHCTNVTKVQMVQSPDTKFTRWIIDFVELPKS